MARVIVYLVLSVFLVCCECIPIKRSTNVQDDDCYGTECYYSDLDTTNEIVLPENLTEVVLVNLPLISHSQGKIVNILDNQMEGITSQMENQERIVSLLANQQASLDAHTETQNQTVKILEGVTTQIANQAASLSTQVNQDQIVSLLSNQTVTLDLIATFLNNITGSLNTMITKHDHMENMVDHQQESLSTLVLLNVDGLKLKDCADIALHSYLTEPYNLITPHGASKSYNVRCDLETDGGGWTVIQHRFDGSVDFYRDWQDYVDGFGDPYGEYWAGLEFIHLLTKTGMWELRVDLEDFNGTAIYAHYTSFRVGNAMSKYRLSYGTYSGTAGNGMKYENGDKFSTRDNDNDASIGSRCAETHKGGWWYSECSWANPNGKYLGPNQVNEEGFTWWAWKKKFEVLKKSEMKIRRI